MRKYLSFFLALIFIISVPKRIDAARDDNLIRDTLNALSIFEDYGEQNFNEDTVITKSHMCNIIVQALGLEDYVRDRREYTYFKDVPLDYWALNQINTCCELGIVSGNGENFEPEKEISGYECITMWVCAMNYKAVAELRGGYPNGYVLTANRLGMLDGVSISEKMTGSDVAAIIYNSLEVKFLDTDGVIADETILSRNNIFHSDGRVVKNSTSTLAVGETPEKDGYVNIDGICYNTGETNISEYLGYYVDFYYEEIDDDYIVKCFSVKRNAQTFSIQAEDIIEFSNGSITYLKNDKRSTVRISNSPSVIYNGRASSLKDSLTGIKNGEVILLNSGVESKYDVIFVNEYVHCIVTAVSSQSEQIYFSVGKIDENGFIDLKDKEYSIIKNGKNIELDDISKGDVAAIRISKDKEVVSIDIFDENLISGVLESADAAETFVIDGVQYDVSPEFSIKNNEEVQIGFAAKFYTDILGKIFYADFTKIGVKEYGVIFKLMSDFDMDKKFIRLLTEDGTVERFELADKVKMENAKSDSGAYFSKKMENDEAYGYLYAAEQTEVTMISFELDEEGKINKIELPLKGDAEGSDTSGHTLNLKVSNGAYFAYGRFGDVAHVTDSTKVFVVVPDENGSYSDQKSLVTTQGYFSSGKTYGTSDSPLWFYNVGRDGIADAVVYLERNMSEYASLDAEYYEVCICTGSYGTMVDEYGDIRNYVSLYTGGSEKKVLIAEDCKPGSGSLIEDLSLLEFGDALVYTTDKNGDMNGYFVVQRVNDFKEGAMFMSGGGYYTVYATAVTIFAGTAYNNDDYAFRIKANNSYYTFPHSGTTYVKVNLNERTVEPASRDDCICPDTGFTGKNSKVILNASRNKLLSVIIYEEN